MSKQEHNNKGRNHPSWYDKYEGAKLINLDFGVRKDKPVYGNQAIPNILCIDMVNMIPCSRESLTTPWHINTGWTSAISKMYATIRSANSSVSPYTEDDLQKYVFDVNALHILYCTVRRMYSLLFNYSAYDGRMPRAIAEAVGIDYDDFVAHAADLQVYGNLFALEIETKYPLKVDLIERSRWLTSNIFKDGKAVKENYYICDFYYKGGVRIYDGLTQQWTRGRMVAPASYQSFITAVNDVREAVAGNLVFNRIASEIRKAYGDAMVYKAETWPDNLPMNVVHDPYILSQLQNAWSPLNGIGTNQNTPVQDWSYRVPLGSEFVVNEAQELNLLGILNGRYVNTQKNSMSTGETLSIMRLTSYSQAYIDNSTNELVLGILSYNTELVTNMRMVISSGEPAVLQVVDLPMVKLSAVSTLALSLDQFGELGTLSFALSTFEYAPRTIRIITNGVTDITIPYYAWDFDNYAEYPSLNAYDSMGSYASLSLLDVPVIKKQSTWKGKDKPFDGKENKKD